MFQPEGSPEEIDKAAAAIELNLLDTNLSVEKLERFQVIVAQESETMMARIFDALLSEGFSTEEISSLFNSVLGTVTESPDAFRLKE